MMKKSRQYLKRFAIDRSTDLLYFDEENRRRIYLPFSLRESLLKQMHRGPQSSHFGIRTSYERIRNNYFWPNMKLDCEKYCSSCGECTKTKRAEHFSDTLLQPILASKPFEIWGIDFVGPLPRTARGMQYILVLTDYFSKWPEAIPTRDQTAETVVKKLVELFARFGVPKNLISDKGPAFESEILQKLSTIFPFQRLRTSGYHPQTNGQVERLNQTIGTMLKTHVNASGTDWDLWLPTVLMGFRSAINSDLKKSPYEIVYGTNMPNSFNKPVDPQSIDANIDDYFTKLRSTLRNTHKQIREIEAVDKEKMKKSFDEGKKVVPLHKGDLLLIKNPKMTSKLEPKWKKNYVLVEDPSKDRPNVLEVKDLSTDKLYLFNRSRVRKVPQNLFRSEQDKNFISIEKNNSIDQPKKNQSKNSKNKLLENRPIKIIDARINNKQFVQGDNNQNNVVTTSNNVDNNQKQITKDAKVEIIDAKKTMGEKIEFKLPELSIA